MPNITIEIPMSSKQCTKQCTIEKSFSVSGKGLHTGVEVSLTVKPDKENTGIKFCRVDLPSSPIVPALADYVVETSRSTVIAKDDAKVSTIEHLMAALWSMGIDNALIELNGPEVPILDGSAVLWVKNIEQAGIKEQNAERKFYEVQKRVNYRMDERDSEITAYPDNNYTISVHVDFGSKVVGKQYATFDSENQFAEAIAPCRTFVFFHEMAPLIEMGYIKGGDLSNAIVVIENPITGQQAENIVKRVPNLSLKQLETPGYVTEGGLRYENEIARHKMLDLMGDLALIGIRIKGHILATRPGHCINTEFAKVMRKTIKMDEVKSPYQYNPNTAPLFTTQQILDILPHRPPMLLLDKVMELDDDHIVGVKQVTMSEPWYLGHFPGAPIMPGVLQVEAMAQCGGILVLHKVENPKDYETYFLKLEEVKFRSKVLPGDTLVMTLYPLAPPLRHGIIMFQGRAYVGDTIACEATMTVMLQKKEDKQ